MNRQQLERGADAIEAVLYQHQAAVKVTGGQVTPRAVQFMAQPGQGVKVTRIESLTREIAVALGVPFATVTRSGGAVRIDVPRSDPQPVQLVKLLDRVPREKVPPCAALLGLADDGAPLLVRFPSADVGHALISGPQGSGKTSLIVSMLLSLAYYNKPRHVQIVALGSGLDCLRTLPHMLEVNELQRLIARPASEPRIVVAVDEPRADILPTLATFAVRGAAVGVHVIAAAREPLDLPVKVRITADDQRVQGRQPGDFWAEWAGYSPAIRFQAAHIAANEIGSFIQSLK